MKWLKILIIFFILCSTKLSFAVEISDKNVIFNQANQEYNAGNYKKALELYEKLDNENIRSASLFFNMGNLYLSFNQNTKALAFFIKAKKLAPFDKEINEGIKKVKGNVDLDIKELNSFFIWNDFISLEKLIWVTLVFWSTLCFFYLYCLSKKKHLLSNSFYILIFINATLFVSLISKITDQFSPKAIIVSKSADIKTSFDSSGISIKKLSEGSIVNVIEKTTDGIKIKNPDKLSGWVRNSSIVVIE